MHTLPCRPWTSWRRALTALGAVLSTTLAIAAFAQDQDTDPPGRVAYLNEKQGTISVSPNGDDSWYESVPNRPFTQGDRLWTDRNSRAELYVGDTAIRMDEQTQLEITELGDQSLRLTVQQGRVQLRLRGDAGGEQQRVELGTGNLAVVMRAAGDYRVQADPQADTTQVMVAQGNAPVFGENGQSQELGNRQQAVYTGRDLSAGGAPQAMPAAFDRWLAERGQAEEQSQSARYISREIPGYQQLDAYGQWQNDPTYGAVWYPSNVASDWAPYSDGYWAVVAPYGYTWIDRAPWGFAPSHYGRWTRIGPRWCWVPGPRHARPVYSPALVAFVGGSGGRITAHGGRPAVGWFPLAPGERWRPPYRASERYIDRANRTIAGVPPLVGRPDYANRSLPHAVTAVPVDRFGRGGPMGRRDFVRPPAPALAAAPVSQRPPVPVPAVHAGGAGTDRRADWGFPGRRTQAAPPPALAALAPPADRFQGNPGERRPRPPEAAPRPPQLGQPGIALPQQQQQQQQFRQQQQQAEDAQRRNQQFLQQREQMRQQRDVVQAQQQQQMAQRQQAERFEQERQQLQQQQDNQRRIRQAQQDQERQQRDNLYRHNLVQQQQAQQRQQTERAQRELSMQRAQQQAAMRDQMEQQQRQQQMDRQQRQQQMDLQRQQQQQQQQQQAMRAQQEQAQRQAQMQQQQMQQQQMQQQMARQQQEAQMRAQQQQQRQQQPGGPNRMRGVPGITDNSQQR